MPRYDDTLTPLIRRLDELRTQLAEIREGLVEDPHRISHEMWILQETNNPRDAARSADAIADALHNARQAVVRASDAVDGVDRIVRSAQRRAQETNPHG